MNLQELLRQSDFLFHLEAGDDDDDNGDCLQKWIEFSQTEGTAVPGWSGGRGRESSGVTNFFSSRAVQGLPASLPATFFATNCQLVVGNIYGQQDSRAEYNSSTPPALILTTRNIIQLIFAHLS